MNKNEPYFDLINDIMIKQVWARVKFVQAVVGLGKWLCKNQNSKVNLGCNSRDNRRDRYGVL